MRKRAVFIELILLIAFFYYLTFLFLLYTSLPVSRRKKNTKYVLYIIYIIIESTYNTYYNMRLHVYTLLKGIRGGRSGPS